jgi:hypothetical protein
VKILGVYAAGALRHPGSADLMFLIWEYIKLPGSLIG